MKTIVGYHFTSDTLRDGSPIPPAGQWLRHDGPVIPCKSGLHASEHPFDALAYAPGAILHRVELREEIQSHGQPIDKWVGRERRIIASIDATELLRTFARHQALSVAHLWDAPDIALEYLFTGDNSLQAAARDAASAAAWAAASAAARGAASAAAWAAARGAAWGAARDAASAAAWAAACAAARQEFMQLVTAAFSEL